MPVRNGPRSQRGRSAIARRVINTNSTNGMMPQLACHPTNRLGQPLLDATGQPVVIKPCRYFGGDKKGGAQPSGTGFMISFGMRHNIATHAAHPNFLFKSFTGAGHAPYQVGAPLL